MQRVGRLAVILVCLAVTTLCLYPVGGNTKVADGAGRQLPDRVVRVRVTGQQRKWQFAYPGADGVLSTSDDVIARQELRLPTDSDVELRLESQDFVYTFSVPEFELNEIAVPDLEHTLRFRTKRPGTYKLPAEPLCGAPLFHDEALSRMIVVEPDRFASWVTAVTHPSESGR